MVLADSTLWVADLRVAWPLPLLYWLIQYGIPALAVIPEAGSLVANGRPSILMFDCGVTME
jgi:hypothetical protein